MPRLDKGTLALTFKFDCDRFLRFRLASDAEKDSLGIEADTYKRPGIELIKAAGRRWEADKYQDLIDVSPPDAVEYVEKEEVDELVGRKPFGKVENLFEILQRETPPFAIIEAEFEVPSNITPGLQEAYDTYGLETVRARPDIIWVRPGGTGHPLIGDPDPVPEFELHVIDVKMAAEPSLRHFTEVTYYALSLAAALAEQGLSDRYAVSAEGFIWPGSHDANAFRNLVREYEARGDSDPVTSALQDTLVPVPYEVYQVHVKQFFEERLLRVLEQRPEEASWHVGPKCQLCDYVRYCKQEAENCDHLSRLPWLNQGQAELLRQKGIATTQGLRPSEAALRSGRPQRRQATSFALIVQLCWCEPKHSTPTSPSLLRDADAHLCLHGATRTSSLRSTSIPVPALRSPWAPPECTSHRAVVRGIHPKRKNMCLSWTASTQ